jgi:XTP/dITP diphosphohydrolase
MNKIILASNNIYKIREFNEILSRENIELIPQLKLNIPEVDETGLSFVENAILKARNASLLAKLPSIADDSGIEVDALSGKPGIYSARYAGEDSDDKANNKLLLEELIGIPVDQRTARYHCTIVYLPFYNHPVPRIYSANWEGYIGIEEEGDNGFGYDPLFFLPKFNCTAAKLSEKQKNDISHRGKALKLFKNDFLMKIKSE